jgi:hypothetical protein
MCGRYSAAGNLSELAKLFDFICRAPFFAPRYNGLALGAGGDFAVVADPDADPLAPDKRPPRQGGTGRRTERFFGEGLFSGGVRSFKTIR